MNKVTRIANDSIKQASTMFADMASKLPTGDYEMYLLGYVYGSVQKELGIRGKLDEDTVSEIRKVFFENGMEV